MHDPRHFVATTLATFFIAGTAHANPQTEPSTSSVEDAGDSMWHGELLEQPVSWQLRLGWETTSFRLHDLPFSGIAEEPHTWSIKYRTAGLPFRLVTHGAVLQPNLIYQPSTLPLQLLGGLVVGMGFGAPARYAYQSGDVSVRPDPEQGAFALRGGASLGLRVPIDRFALRGQLVPGVVMLTVDEIVMSPEGEARGTSAAVTETVRGQTGLDIRLLDDVPFGLTVDVGYDFARPGSWNLGAGIALLSEPE
ncbi:MAG: hypothetical protein RIF41_37385 [Polyangiaceae bacterium]